MNLFKIRPRLLTFETEEELKTEVQRCASDALSTFFKEGFREKYGHSGVWRLVINLHIHFAFNPHNAPMPHSFYLAFI